MAKSRQSLGKKGEALAIQYLTERGYTILDRNFRFDRGEIDIVARDSGVIVFIEVKTRKTGSVGAPEEAVTARKRDQIWKVAEGYLYERQLSDAECRFDVIAVKQENGSPKISHFKDVFSV